VLIKGMDMPKSCKSCDLLQDYDGDMYCPLNSYLNFGDIENVPDYVMDGCPLVEVKTPHGRLVDADSAMEKLATDKREAYTKHDVWLKFSIYGAPTVLEVEE
jgi:hypothetical protein